MIKWEQLIICFIQHQIELPHQSTYMKTQCFLPPHQMTEHIFLFMSTPLEKKTVQWIAACVHWPFMFSLIKCYLSVYSMIFLWCSMCSMIFQVHACRVLLKAISRNCLTTLQFSECKHQSKQHHETPRTNALQLTRSAVQFLSLTMQWGNSFL